MNALAERIAHIIETQGPISVAQFMTLCLHDPEYGAYAARNPLGAKGDYVTAPDISQTFGEMCGLWLVQSWHNQGRPDNPLLVELGPGRGTLMKDILRTIAAAAPKLHAQLRVRMVEASPPLIDIQKKLLSGAHADIAWAARFEDIVSDDQESRPLFLFANEFFDCLPIHQYVRKGDGWCEKMVTVADGALALVLAKLPLPPALPGIEAAPEDAVAESCPAAAAIIEDIAKTLATRGGTALIIDYGYAAPPLRDTLQAVMRHKYTDVLSAPGTSDLTAHVDFSALRTAAERGGAAVYGPLSQGDLLVNLGIEIRVEKLAFANPDSAKSIVAGVKRLIAPDKMGELFKAVALTPAGAPKPPGF